MGRLCSQLVLIFSYSISKVLLTTYPQFLITGEKGNEESFLLFRQPTDNCTLYQARNNRSMVYDYDRREMFANANISNDGTKCRIMQGDIILRDDGGWLQKVHDNRWESVDYFYLNLDSCRVHRDIAIIKNSTGRFARNEKDRDCLIEAKEAVNTTSIVFASFMENENGTQYNCQFKLLTDNDCPLLEYKNNSFLAILEEGCNLEEISTRETIEQDNGQILENAIKSKFVAARLSEEPNFSLFKQFWDDDVCYKNIDDTTSIHLKLGRSKKALYKPGAHPHPASKEGQECWINGHFEYRYNHEGFWFHVNNPAEQIAFQFQPLQPCHTYIDVGIYLPSGGSLDSATAENCVSEAINKTHDSLSHDNFLFISASRLQNNDLDQQKFQCLYQSLTGTIQLEWRNSSYFSNLTVYHEDCGHHRNNIAVVQRNGTKKMTRSRKPKNDEKKTDNDDGSTFVQNLPIPTIIGGCVGALMLGAIIGGLLWCRKRVECLLWQDQEEVEANGMYGASYRDQDDKVTDDNSLYDYMYDREEEETEADEETRYGIYR